MDPFIVKLSVKKFLAVAGIGLVGLTGLTACTGGSGEDAETGTETEAEAEETAEAAPVVVECDYTPVDAAPEAGLNIDAPLEMCTPGMVDTWDVAVTAVEADATETILGADASNAAPAAGSQYFMITLTGTNKGDAAAAPTDLLVGARNEAFTFQSPCGIVPNDLLDVAEIAPGESFTANKCVTIESDKVEGAIIEMALLNSWEAEVYTYFASA
ncbi:hypothetical protein [Glycomyces harbinensis]|uniref:DUF4352 domain-containing protein n=1 Tax=Glycomyces harbinensis TaxID=58114 RepID=A0A1G7AAP0_9ACTN|nr:hypothetical protein [Glycomyces harbinensis]SDE11820.1 hypothetical protein SAMN05216270_11331 [Glycomyces harbinensis]